MIYLLSAIAVAVVVLNGIYLFRLIRRPSPGAAFQQVYALVLLALAALAFYTYGNINASKHEILAKSDGTVINGPVSSFQLGSEPDRILIAREDCVFTKIRHGKDLVAVTVRYRVLDSFAAARLFELMPPGEGARSGYFRNYLKRSISIPAEIPSSEVRIALALQASFMKYVQAGLLVTVQSVAVIEDGAEMRRFTDE